DYYCAMWHGSAYALF
nr:immunoglobulin light chain junction region [Macaca mulatta]MOX80418.1 immunoglobulin light chain junction region [Macaca mulatta]MOX81672.1 immunoglobulin light chain junction region [Macaca mulatta]MOX82034.1 immunoglobulin light chain junction region [Macaca mulatta]MOX84092.1 immunoglobulin light chain junction region [Macaca mulatta]